MRKYIIKLEIQCPKDVEIYLDQGLPEKIFVRAEKAAQSSAKAGYVVVYNENNYLTWIEAEIGFVLQKNSPKKLKPV